MDIILNGEARPVEDRCTIGQLLEALELSGARLAVEVNQAIVPRSSFAQHRLAEGDRVEVVHAIGGG